MIFQQIYINNSNDKIKFINSIKLNSKSFTNKNFGCLLNGIMKYL